MVVSLVVALAVAGEAPVVEAGEAVASEEDPLVAVALQEAGNSLPPLCV